MFRNLFKRLSIRVHSVARRAAGDRGKHGIRPRKAVATLYADTAMRRHGCMATGVHGDEAARRQGMVGLLACGDGHGSASTTSATHASLPASEDDPTAAVPATTETGGRCV